MTSLAASFTNPKQLKPNVWGTAAHSHKHMIQNIVSFEFDARIFYTNIVAGQVENGSI